MFAVRNSRTPCTFLSCWKAQREANIPRKRLIFCGFVMMVCGML